MPRHWRISAAFTRPMPSRSKTRSIGSGIALRATLFEQETQESEKELPMQNPPTHYSARALGNSRGSHPRRTALMQRLGLLAAAVFLLALVGSMALVFYAVRHTHGGTASPHSTPAISTARVPLKVTSVSISVTP